MTERLAICVWLDPAKNLCHLVYPNDPYAIESRPIPQIEGVNDVGTILGKWLECSSSDNRRGFVLANDGLFKIVAVKCGQVEVHAPVLFLADLSQIESCFKKSSLDADLLELEYSAPVFALPGQWKNGVNTQLENNVLYEGKLMIELVPNSAPKWRLIDVFDQWDCEMDTFGNYLLENSISYGRLLKKHDGGNIASILDADGKLAFGEITIKDDKNKLSEGQWIEYFEFIFNYNGLPLRWAVGCLYGDDIDEEDMFAHIGDIQYEYTLNAIDHEENMFELCLDAIAQSIFEPKTCWLKGIGKLHGPEEYLYKLAVALTNEQVVYLKLQCHIYIDCQTVFWLIKQISTESFFNGKSATMTTPPPLENGSIGKSININATTTNTSTMNIPELKKKTPPTATVAPMAVIISQAQEWNRNRIAVYMKTKGNEAILLECKCTKNRNIDKFKRFLELKANCISYTGITIGDWFQLDYSVKSQRTGMRKNISLENVMKLDPLVPTRIRDGETEFLVAVVVPSEPNDKNSNEYQTTIGILTFEPTVNVGDKLWCRFDDKCLNKVKQCVKEK